MSDGSKIAGLESAQSAPGQAGGLVGLGRPKAAPAPGQAGGLTGLGTPKPATPAPGQAGGLTGLGTPKPEAPAPAAAGLTGLGGGSPAPAPKKPGIQIDTTAAQRIERLLADRGTPAAGLRIRVRGGGCTGLQYDMEFADQARDRDRVFEEHGVRIFVDPKSYIFLIGTMLTYQSGLLESGFKLENPNVKKACGCGESFSI